MKYKDVDKTNHNLRVALMHLLQKRPFDEISISDLCDKADIHRTTYYRYYDDKYELFKDACEHWIDHLYEAGRVYNTKNKEQRSAVLDITRGLLLFLNDNPSFINKMFIGKERDLIYSISKGVIEAKVAPLVEEDLSLAPNLKINHDFVKTFGTMFISGSTFWWANNNNLISSSLFYEEIKKTLQAIGVIE